MKTLKRKENGLLLSILLILVFSISLNTSELKAQIKEEAKSLAPFVPTPYEIVQKMLEIAEVKKTDVVYDLGCGDGRIVATAAEKFGAHAVGVDYDPQRIAEANETVKSKKVEKLVKIVYQDIMKVDLSPATVVTLYLLESSNALLQPNLEKYLKPGSRVVSHDFSMRGWTPKKVETVQDNDGDEHTIYLWIMGQQKQGEPAKPAKKTRKE
jgi:SAM-dependent methyltransferase